MSPAGDCPGILDRLHEDKAIQPPQVGWSITNLGMCASHETIREQQGGRGYAAGSEGLIRFVDGLLPKNEIIGQALRSDRSRHPIFNNRMEITRPGKAPGRVSAGQRPLPPCRGDRI